MIIIKFLWLLYHHIFHRKACPATCPLPNFSVKHVQSLISHQADLTIPRHYLTTLKSITHFQFTAIGKRVILDVIDVAVGTVSAANENFRGGEGDEPLLV